MITFDGMMSWGPGGSGLEAITGRGWHIWVPLGITVLIGFLFILFNMVVDILLAYIDPKIHL